MTGRENVYLSGAILGMRRAEISAKLDQIIEFAGIGEFIDTPTKWYSSGMYVRLGFAVSAHVDPDILLVDEVLAVGDEAFQERCFERIHALRQAGTTIVLISHDLAAVERLCQRALLLQAGSVVKDATPAEITRAHRQWAAARTAPRRRTPAAHPRSSLPAERAATNAGVPSASGGPAIRLTVTLTFDASTRIEDVVFEVGFTTQGGSVLRCVQTTALDGSIELPPGRGEVEFACSEIGLQPGVYNLVATAARMDGTVLASHTLPLRLVVEHGKMVRGYFYMPHRWVLRSADAAEAGATMLRIVK